MDNNRKNTQWLRSLVEAHIYVAVAMADGKVTQNEVTYAPYYAEKSQKSFNILKSNQGIQGQIKKDIRSVFRDPEFRNWTAEMHLERALELLAQAKKAGDWAVRLTADKNEIGLEEVAAMDNYYFKESKFLKEVYSRLKAL